MVKESPEFPEGVTGTPMSESGHGRVKIDIVENPFGYPTGVRLMEIDLGNEVRRSVPVFNSRIGSHHPFIAQRIASGEPSVAFGVGLYGLSVNVPHVGFGEADKDHSGAFFQTKSERSANDKIPMFIRPDDLLEYMDLEKVHPDFRKFFETPEDRAFLWESGIALHIIGPIKDDPRIDPVFITTPQVAHAKNLPDQPFASGSFFWWDDPDMRDIAEQVHNINPNAIGGISSFNGHGEAPAWDFQGVMKFVRDKEIVPFDFVVTDPIGEAVGVKSSFDQIGVPMIGQDPIWTVYRTGPTDLDLFVRTLNERHGTNFGYKILPGAKKASRGHPTDAYLHDKLTQVRELVNADYALRHPNK